VKRKKENTPEREVKSRLLMRTMVIVMRDMA